MTAHELARQLLAGPDLDVMISEYNGGNDALREVKCILPDGEDQLILETYDWGDAKW